MACSPMMRISRCTRFRLTHLPSPRQLDLHPPRLVEGVLQVLPVHGLHQKQAITGDSPRPIVQAGDQAGVAVGRLLLTATGGEGRLGVVLWVDYGTQTLKLSKLGEALWFK